MCVTNANQTPRPHRFLCISAGLRFLLLSLYIYNNEEDGFSIEDRIRPQLSLRSRVRFLSLPVLKVRAPHTAPRAQPYVSSPGFGSLRSVAVSPSSTRHPAPFGIWSRPRCVVCRSRVLVSEPPHLPPLPSPPLHRLYHQTS